MADAEDVPPPEQVPKLIWTFAEKHRELRDIYRSRAREFEGLANAHDELIEPLQALGKTLRPDLLADLRSRDSEHYSLSTGALVSNNAAVVALLQEERDSMTVRLNAYTFPASGAAVVDLGFTMAHAAIPKGSWRELFPARIG